MFGEYCTLVSDFTGADENPLSEGGNWAALNSAGNQMQRISNAAAGTVAGVSRSYWTPANFGPDLEAYISFSTISTGTHAIACRIQGEGGSNTWDGYLVQAQPASTSTFINVITNNSGGPVITGVASSVWADGDKLGVRAIGSKIQAWRLPNGSSTWELVATIVDTTYAAAGKVGMSAGSTTVRIDDFYAGLPAEDAFGFRH